MARAAYALSKTPYIPIEEKERMVEEMRDALISFKPPNSKAPTSKEGQV